MSDWGPDNPHPLSQIKTELIWGDNKLVIWIRLTKQSTLTPAGQ